MRVQINIECVFRFLAEYTDSCVGILIGVFACIAPAILIPFKLVCGGLIKPSVCEMSDSDYAVCGFFNLPARQKPYDILNTAKQRILCFNAQLPALARIAHKKGLHTGI